MNNLNENQMKAVSETEGPLLILAGAGSGKTRVITNRIAYLINEKKVHPSHIFAVTFTNKAAEEMKVRVINLIGQQGDYVFIKTFHSAAVYILRNFGDRIGIDRSFTIYDLSDQQAVIKELLLQMRLDPKKIRPSTIVSKISEMKDKTALSATGNQIDSSTDYYSFDFTDLYNQYNDKLRELNALDFNDLLIKTVELFKSAPDVLQVLQKRWRFFMIDEYQDTNYAQYLITKYLSSSSKNICVVGDDDQSIYSWRGADIKNILNFEHDYNDTKIITLDVNYRSTEPILNAARKLISNNINRKGKSLKAVKEDGEDVVWCRANNEYGEAEFVINTVISMKLKYGHSNRDFAIFYRTNAQSRLFEDQLRKEGIPYRVIGGLKFYDRKEIKDILAYLKFIVNPRNSISMYRIINTPSRGIGKATISKIKSTSGEKSISDWDAVASGSINGKISRGLKEFIDLIKKSMDKLSGVPHEIKLSDFINSIIDDSGYRAALLDENSFESRNRIDNLDEFLNSVINFEIYNPDSTLDHFIQEISLYTSEQNPEAPEDEADNLVTLMTVHNAKGLEFPVVFLTGMEENIFPHVLSIDTDETIEEERRLCYVGMTRAMDTLFLTNAEIRRTYNNYGETTKYREPSRFIFEISHDHLRPLTYGTENNFIPNKLNFSANTPILENNAGKSNFRNTNFKYCLYDRVMHPSYGIGKIVNIDGKGDNVKLTISFGSAKKIFLEKYTPLEKLS